MNSEFTIAVHSLAYLAYRPDRMANSETISENVSTHPARVRKVMAMLRKAGYVAAKEGTGGGFYLDCAPDEIRLSELYRIISFGTLQPGWCSGNPEGDCAVACNIHTVMDEIFGEAEQQVIAYLGKWTIGDVVGRIKRLQKEQ